jgi:hypothetical protein
VEEAFIISNRHRGQLELFISSEKKQSFCDLALGFVAFADMARSNVFVQLWCFESLWKNSFSL